MPKWAALILIAALLGLFMVFVVMPALFVVIVAVTQIAAAVPAVNPFVYLAGWAVLIAAAGCGIIVAIAWAKGRINRRPRD